LDTEWFQVKRVYHRLKELGVPAWFDEEATMSLLPDLLCNSL